MSVCHVLYPETMDESKTKPRDQGLNDPRLGSIDRQYKCATCDQNMAECPGHFGHIELAKPVYHPGFIKKIKKLLEMVCHNCGRVKLDRVSYPHCVVDPMCHFANVIISEQPTVQSCCCYSRPEAQI